MSVVRNSAIKCVPYGDYLKQTQRNPLQLYYYDSAGQLQKLGTKVAIGQGGVYIDNKGEVINDGPYYEIEGDSIVDLCYGEYNLSGGEIGSRISYIPAARFTSKSTVADKEWVSENFTINYKKTSTKSAIDNMIAGIPIVASIGERCCTGGTFWKRITNDNNDISDFEVISTSALLNDFGLHSDGITSNTSIYEYIVESLPAGLTLKWLKGSYVGSFVSEDKGFTLERGESEFISDSDTDAIFRFGETEANEYDVAESELNHLDTQFTVIGASTFFNIGDIGYLWDQAERPNGGAVNFEVIKIEDINGDLITVEGFLASYKGASNIKFFHSQKQLKDVYIKGGKLKPTSTHTAYCDVVLNAERVKVEKLDCSESTGPAFSYRYCYDLTVDDAKTSKPLAVTSGKGYGVQLFAVSQFSVKNVIGESCRHAYDQDNAYFGVINGVSDMDDQASLCTIAHNGFTGYITVENVNTSSEQYPVNASAQGYGGTPSADAAKHPFRSISISKVTNTVKNKTANDFNVNGVYLQNSIEHCSIDDVYVRHINQSQLTSSSASSCVRVLGVVRGTFSVKKIDVDKTGLLLNLANTDADSRGTDGITSVETIRVGEAIAVARVAGEFDVLLSSIKVSQNLLGDSLVVGLASGGRNPLSIRVSDFYYPTDVTKKIVSCENAATYGNIERVTRNSSNVTTFFASDMLTAEYWQNRSAYCGVRGDVGTSTVDVKIDSPQLSGCELSLVYTDAERNTLKFLADENNQNEFEISPGESVDLVSVAGKWLVKSRGQLT